MHNSNLPTLDEQNFDFWYQALCNAAIIIDAQPHVVGDPPEPVDPAQAAQFVIKQAKVRNMIMKSLPLSITQNINPDLFRNTLHQICNALKDQVTNTTSDDHDLLKEEARAIQYTPEQPLAQYVEEHEKLRAKMINAKYPGIENEKVTVQFMIHGLRFNPDYITTGEQMVRQPPLTIKQFSRELLHAVQRHLAQWRSSEPTTRAPSH